MGGGLMQLVAYGAQDVYLTGEPQITFFKVVYRRHTNFAIESILQDFNGTVNLGKNVTATISRNGDLVAGMHVEFTLDALTGTNELYANGIGHQLLETVEVEIGGQKIDKHYSEWLDIWDELTGTASKREGYGAMVGKVYHKPTALVAGAGGNPVGHVAGEMGTNASQYGSGTVSLYVPLQFWFNRNPGLALPLIALQYHEVKILIKFRALSDVAVSVAAADLADNVGTVAEAVFNAKLYVDYIYLDTEERRRFAQMSHEYLIDQLQFTGAETTAAGSASIRLNFNHPVKELVWVYRATANEDNNDYLNFNVGIGSIGEAMKNAKVMLNGHDRAAQRDASYYRLMQPWQHHTSVPQKPIYCYSFALRPEEHQPSGTCNFSRIDNATLKVENETFTGSIYVYAVNYNVLRVVSGMGGLAYSN